MTIAPETLEFFHAIDADLRPGYRAELVAGAIVVNPPPNGTHETLISRIAFEFKARSAVAVDTLTTRGIQTPLGLYVPDITVVEYGSAVGGVSWATTAGVLLVAEVTSSNVGVDRDDKRHSYAAADIPLYLLADRKRGELILFSEPDVESQDYVGETVRVPLGSDLELPAPFSFRLTDYAPLNG